jgi:hypothetical protein
MQKKSCEKGSEPGTPKTMTRRMFSSGVTIPTVLRSGVRGNTRAKEATHLRQDSVAGVIDPETSKNE